MEVAESPRIKFCPRCKTHRSTQDFPKNRTLDDGLSCWCKCCHKAANALRRGNPEYLAKYRLYQRRWYQTEPGRASRRRRAALERLRHPDKMIARRAVGRALEKNLLVRQPCFCGDSKTEGHHEDYSKPLEVVWLCKKHHEEKKRIHVREVID